VLGDGAPLAILLSQCLVKVQLRLKPHGAHQRIELVHRFELDQPALCVVDTPRHGPRLRHFGEARAG
jgi:hypothetical protein